MKQPQWKVPYVCLKEQFADPKPYYDAIDTLVKEGDFTLGKELARFERRVAEKLGVKHAIGVASGTDALILPLRCLDIGPGDEVITAPNSFVATAAAIAMVGATPVFADVCDDYTIDPSEIEKKISKKTKAIIPVHLTGWPADMHPIMKIAKKHHLHVVEDAAQSFCTKYDDTYVGTIGITGGYSFHPFKILNVWGDGGMIVTNDDEMARKLRLWRNHGLRTREEVEFFAINSRLDTLHAAIGNHILSHVDEIIKKRQQSAGWYDMFLADLEPHVHFPARKHGSVSRSSIFAYYVIQAKKRDDLKQFLQEKGVETVIQYPIPIHLQKAASYLKNKRGDFPVCEKQADMILTLPNHQYLTKQDVEYVSSCIHAFYMA